MEIKIKKHNLGFVNLFNDTLKPKFHNLVHYPTIARQSGPLRNLWCFKYEANHRQFKIYSHCITSRKNICLTLSKKYELKFAYSLTQLNNNINNCNFTVNKVHEIESNHNNLLITELRVEKSCLNMYSHISYRGSDYTCGQFVSLYTSEIVNYIQF